MSSPYARHVRKAGPTPQNQPIAGREAEQVKMGSGMIAGTSLTPREGAGALALVTAATEPNHMVVGYTAAGADGWTSRNRRGNSFGYTSSDGVTPLAITPRMRLDTVVDGLARLPFGGTDCALPMLYAMEKELEIDAFVSITDNESWAGSIHPTEALAQYRKKSGIDAKMAVIAMTATQFSVADKSDPRQMDFCGFDTAVPQLLADFIRS